MKEDQYFNVNAVKDSSEICAKKKVELHAKNSATVNGDNMYFN